MALFTKQKVGQVRLLETAAIASNPFQPRKCFEPEALKELAESIAANGLLQPVTVRKVGEEYQLIAGERRLLACRMLQLEKIPALIESYDDEQSAIFALIENLQRKDLNFFEQAEGMRRLMIQCSLTQEQLAKQLGKSQPTVANKLRLLIFPADLRKKMLDHGLTERHARALLKLPDAYWDEAVAYIVENKLNVGEAEQYLAKKIALLQTPPKKKPTKLFVLRDFRIFMNTISEAVSTMKMAGIEIDTQKIEDEEYIQYTMRIPKKSAYRTHTA